MARHQHKKLKCTGFYLSLPRMKEWDFLIKTRYFQYELNYAQFTVSLIRDFLYCNYSITMGVNNELIFVILSGLVFGCAKIKYVLNWDKNAYLIHIFY